MAERKPAESRRREIADAALRVIVEQGLGRFTALAVAREIGVTDAALFRHFETMEAIVLAVIDRVEEVLFAGFPPPGLDPIERLGNFFRQRVAVIHENPGVAALVTSDSLAQAAPAAAVARVLDLRRRSVRFIRSCLAQAAREGLLARGIAPQEAAVLVIGAIFALTQARRPADGPGRTSAQAERTWRALERLLRGTRRQAVPPLGRRRRPSREENDDDETHPRVPGG